MGGRGEGGEGARLVPSLWVEADLWGFEHPTSVEFPQRVVPVLSMHFAWVGAAAVM